MLYVKEFALYLGRNRDPWKGFLFVCLFFKRERDTYDLCLRKSLWLVGGDRTWAKIGRQEEGLEAGCRLLGRDSEAQPRQWGWGCRERDASESGGLTAQAGKNGKSLLKAAGKNPKHLRVLKMSTSGFFFFFFFKLKKCLIGLSHVFPSMRGGGDPQPLEGSRAAVRAGVQGQAHILPAPSL